VALSRSQDGDLFFSVSPAEHSVVEGRPVRLRCEAQPSSRVKYSWKMDGQPLAPSPRRHQVEGDLYITRVNRILDSGKFVCVATHEETGYSIESSPAKIDVQCESYLCACAICAFNLRPDVPAMYFMLYQIHRETSLLIKSRQDEARGILASVDSREISTRYVNISLFGVSSVVVKGIPN
jgi:hypothetical protein